MTKILSGPALLRSLLPLLLSTFVLTACDSTDPSDPDDALARELDAVLAKLDGGAEGLRMPAEDNYAAIPQDPRNPITAEKVALGRLLYHETALTVRPKFEANVLQASCASCHHADAGFQAGIPQGIGTGGAGFGVKGEGRDRDPLCGIEDMDIQPIRSPSTLNVAWQKNMLWNGQFGATGVNVGTEGAWTAGTPKEVNHLGYEGIEIQAIAGQDVHRMEIETSMLVENATYSAMFDAAFPERPVGERITEETAGLAIAAYERTLLANRAPFQRWLGGDRTAMSSDEIEGAILFFGKAECASCHNGPALNSMEFHAVGMKNLDGPGTYGVDPSKPEHRGRGGFTGRSEDDHKFKVPQLYNLDDSRFYGHGASFLSIRAVVEYFNAGIAESSEVSPSQLSPRFRPLGLTDDEVDDLTTFLTTALRDPDLHRYVPSTLPSGLCFPNNDPDSRRDIGCD